MTQNYVIAQIAAPTGVWTPITPPINCNYFSLKSKAGQAITVRTDPNDPTTEDTLPANAQQIAVASAVSFWPLASGDSFRFPQGLPILYVQPVGNADVIVGTFMK